MARLYLTQHGNRKFMDGYEAYKGIYIYIHIHLYI
jgi:hypothetical protein